MAAFGEDFLQTIIDVQWGDPFAVLTVQSVWVGGVPNPNNSPVIVPQAGLSLPVYTNAPTGNLVRSTKPFHKQSSVKLSPIVTITTLYNVFAEGNAPLSSTVFQVTVTSDNLGNSFWGAVPGVTFPPKWNSIGGEGGIAEAEIGISEEPNFKDFFAPTEQTGQSSKTTPGATVFTDTDNAVFMFNLEKIKQSIKPAAQEIDITYSTGPSPAGIEGATVSYNWTVTLFLFSNGSFTSFPVDSTNLPGKWATPKSTDVRTSPGSLPPNVDIDFTVVLPS